MILRDHGRMEVAARAGQTETRAGRETESECGFYPRSKTTLARLPQAFESIRWTWALHVSRRHLILKHHVPLGSASGIVESDQLFFFHL
jgi:hypothetical protein